MTTKTDLRAAAYDAALAGLVDARPAAIVVGGPPPWRVPAIDVAITVTCGALALVSFGTPYLASLAGSLCVTGLFESAQSIRAYRRARREYLDAVRMVAEAYARLRGGDRG